MQREPPERDPDLVTLEGLESELGDLDAELAQVERTDDGDTAPDAADGFDGAAPPSPVSDA